MTISPEQASIEDLGAVLGLLADAAAWLHKRGYDQWPGEFSHDGRRVPFQAERIRAAIDSGWTHLVWEDGLAVATVTVNALADEEFWADADEGKALYLSKMAVRSGHHHRGLGQQLIDWADGKASSEGARWLRLDAWKSNDDLHRYYKGQGFDHVRTAWEKDHRRSGALFQRSVPFLSCAGGPVPGS